MLEKIRAFAQAHAAWVSAIGLAALAVYDLSVGNTSGAGKAILGAAAAIGLHLRE